MEKSEILRKLEMCLNNRAEATRYFGSASFSKKNLDGKMLKTLANQYKATYQEWLEILSNITDDVCEAWDAHQKQKEAEKYFNSLSSEQKQTMLAAIQATA